MTPFRRPHTPASARAAHHGLPIAMITALLAAAAPAGAQTDLSGEWSARLHEDNEHRIPGPELGDYTGLPLNEAGRLKARTWDASILSQPEQQARPHPAQYSMRGPAPNLRIDAVVDPDSYALVAYRLTGFFGNADRTIWLDDRPHPSPLAEHPWNGFSTGRWLQGGTVLEVTTTHMKAAFIQRNGAPASAKSAMTEYFTRHGDHLIHLSIVEDPAYLEEPMVRSQHLQLNPRQVTGPPGVMEIVDEIAAPRAGYVPNFPIGTRHTEFAERHGLPYETTQGGAATLYPEYMNRIVELREQAR
jgi:hypothetical protein